MSKGKNHFSFWRRVALVIFPRALWMIIWFLAITCRKHYWIEGRDFGGDRGQKGLDTQERYRANFVAIFWHGEFLMLPFAYRYLRNQSRLAVVASRHFHGEIVARLYELFGFEVIRGSSNYGGVNRGGIRVILQALDKIRQGYNIGLTPDGPKGPYHSISDGVFALSDKGEAPIVIFRPKMRRYIQIPTWDRFQIPIPFSRIDYYISAPFFISKTDELSVRKQKIYEKMQALC